MTPTHLSMSHEGKEILRRIVEGLEGVTAGTWVVRETTVNGRGYGGHWLEVANDDNMICISGSGGARSYTMRVIDTQIHDDNEPNLRHFARCSPDAILAIAEYVAAVEKERDNWKELHDAAQRAVSIRNEGQAALVSEIKGLEKERDEFAALFDRRWETDQRAKKRWQDAHPDQPNTWPSRDDLLVWLMGELSTARRAALLEAAEIAEAHASQCRSKLNKKRSDHDIAVFESAMSEAVSIAAAIRKLAEEA